MRRRVLVVAMVAIVGALAVATGAQGTNDLPKVRASSPGAFEVVGKVKQRLVLNTAVLALLPQQTVDATYRSGNSTEHHVFVGPRLRDVLALAQPQFDPAIKNDKLRHYVTATGSDGYQALVAWGEFDPEFGNREILLAVSQDGESLADQGPRLVVPGDDRGGRYVSGVVRVRLDAGR